MANVILLWSDILLSIICSKLKSFFNLLLLHRFIQGYKRCDLYTFNYFKLIILNLCKSRNLYLADFKRKRDNYA